VLLAMAPAAVAQAAPAPVTGLGQPGVISQHYVVVLQPGAAPSAQGRVIKKALARGATLGYRYHDALNGFAATLPPVALAEVRNDPDVGYVEADRVITAATTEVDPPWSLDRIDQRNRTLSRTFSYTETGRGVNAYIIDSGIRFTHRDFGGRAVSGYDAIDGGSADDCDGHGTHVAGKVGGARYGVAKDVTLIAVRMLNCSGNGSTASGIAAVDWVTGHHQAGQPAVANLSWGGTVSPATDQAVTASIADGITYVAAAGNDNGDACHVSPARVPGAITVGSTKRSDKRAHSSNFGRCLDVFAPGKSITSDWRTSDTATKTLSGTSMAAPEVAGVAALVLGTDRGASPSRIASIIVDSATVGVVRNRGAGSPDRLLFVPTFASTHLGMMAGTSPSVAAVSSLDYRIAVQANTGFLWTYSSLHGAANLGLGMKAGTSPSIAVLRGGGYQIAFQANTGDLWVTGAAGTVNTHLGMMPGTSPSIAASAGGGYRVAFQANTGFLWTFSSPGGNANLGLGMKAGTSPSIAALRGGGYQIAFQANTGDLWVTGGAGTVNTHLGMMAGTSPGTAASSSGGYRVAFEANTAFLWTFSSPGGNANLGQGMKVGTSPAISARPGGGGYQIGFQANTTELVAQGFAGAQNTHLGMLAATSPSIAAWSGGYVAAIHTNTGELWTYQP
jgi:hypothetical protein